MPIWFSNLKPEFPNLLRLIFPLHFALLYFINIKGAVQKNIKTQNKMNIATYLVTGIDWIPVACLAIGEADMMIRDDGR
jgi:hypothetical protein